MSTRTCVSYVPEKASNRICNYDLHHVKNFIGAVFYYVQQMHSFSNLHYLNKLTVALSTESVFQKLHTTICSLYSLSFSFFFFSFLTSILGSSLFSFFFINSSRKPLKIKKHRQLTNSPIWSVNLNVVNRATY